MPGQQMKCTWMDVKCSHALRSMNKQSIIPTPYSQPSQSDGCQNSAESVDLPNRREKFVW